MNKKLLSVFFAVLLCVVVSVPVFADTAEDYTPHLIDNADLLTGEEESNLLAKLDEISDRLMRGRCRCDGRLHRRQDTA